MYITDVKVPATDNKYNN